MQTLPPLRVKNVCWDIWIIYLIHFFVINFLLFYVNIEEIKHLFTHMPKPSQDLTDNNTVRSEAQSSAIL